MDRIIISGIPSIDGSYEFDWTLSMADARLIKREAGVRFGEIDEALAAGDSDLLIAFAMIALQRAGKNVPSELLWDAAVGSITFENDPEEVEADDPPELAPVSAESVNGHTASSSPSSSGDGEPSPETTSLSGSGALG